MKAKSSFEGTFSTILMVLLGRLFPEAVGFTFGWTCINPGNFMRIGSKLRPILCILLHIKYKIPFQSVLRPKKKMNFAVSGGEAGSF